MEKQEIIKKMISLQGQGDTESQHVEADDLLCAFLIKLGHQDLVDEYNKVNKWYA